MLKKNLIWILLLILTVPSFFTLLRPGFFPMQDDLQAFRIQQMDKCFQDLQIPCRWVPDPGYQYGYPQFNYYPPSVYYLGEITHLIGFQIIDAVKILFILGFVLSAVTMFIFLRSWLGEWPALLGSMLYTYAPYKAVDVYVRGAMSEFWSFVFFPLIFWSSYQLIKFNKTKYLAWLALSVGLLLITHNLMSMIFLPVAAVWSLIWVYLEKKWQILPKLILGASLGLGLAAFFTLPVIWEKQYVHVESMLGGYFDYRQHFVDLNQLFISNHWGYGSSYLGPNDDLSLSTGQVQWLISLLAVILSCFYFKKDKKRATVVFILALTTLLVLFLTHQKSSFIWAKIGILSWLQFPWRILADSVFLLSILGAVAVSLIGKKKVALSLGATLVLLLFIMYGSFFRPLKWFAMSDQEKFSGILWEKELTISIFDYLPIYAKLPPINKAPVYPEVLDGSATFLNYQKGSDYQFGQVKVTSNAKIRLPLFDFPGMKVKIDGQIVKHNHNDCRYEEFCLGLITFDISKGDHTIEAKLNNTPVRTVGNILTAFSILAVGFLFLRSRKL
ncbi:glycosyltransferase family 39 protein [Candidatus Daviesbacteria bacterium]|nr:glycosyltransferase family 39 protein [Candidatus Daviesbacteria bacterium]